MFSVLVLAFLAGPAETEQLKVADGQVLIWRSHALQSGTSPAIERAYIMVHGTSRNAEDYYRWTRASAEAAGKLDTTVVIAPHFKARTAAGRGDEVEPGEWYWTNDAWKAGEAALNGKAFSFDVADRILECLNDPARFPALKEVVVAGHSAGGQYVQRYAAANKMEPKMRVPVRYVVANPSSYVYMSEVRMRQGGTCNERGDCSGTFIKYWDANNCTTYNDYRYGLEKLTGYAAQASAEQIREQFTRRKVTYLVGELDTRTDDPNLDKSCPANAQGAYRRERGAIFWNYMKSQLGAAHEFGIAPGCGHSAVCVFAGPAGVKAVFGAK
ncbi:MAG: alpha/beta hydrolase [Acidobacteria bacterium]|nr:alpha/beta hydrolase [Acidobacteriota bacterium]